MGSNKFVEGKIQIHKDIYIHIFDSYAIWSGL
jgi:hypothetical protein